MGNRQLFAQIGVFALLGLNVGAYYVFWPHNESTSRSEAKGVAKEKGETQLLPAKKDRPTPPIEIPLPPSEVFAGVLGSAAPVNFDIPPPAPPKKNSEDEKLSKLLEHIKKDLAPAPAESETRNDPDDRHPRFGAPEEKKPNPLPPLQADPLLGELKQTSGIVTVPPKTGPSPWLLTMEVVGKQTELRAKLPRSTVGQKPVEFCILCDRLEMKAPGAVQALGKVTVIGAGLTGSCQRLTVPLHETQLVFELDAHIVHDSTAGSSLRGDRIVWEVSASSGVTQPLVTPAEFRPSNSVAPLSPGLAYPK